MSAHIQAVAPPRLCPLSIGDLLDESVFLYRRNWIRLVTIAALVTVPVTVLQAASTWLNVSITSSLGMSGSSGDSLALTFLSQVIQLGVGVIDSIVTVLMTGALIYVAGQSYLGRVITPRQAYGYAARRLLVMIGSYLLAGLIILLLIVASIIPCVGWLGGPPAAAFATINLFLLIVPIVMLEGRGVRASLRRSWMLAKSQFWRVLLLAFVLYLFNLAVIGGPTWVVTVLVLALTQNPTYIAFVTVAVSALANLVFTPIWGVCVTLLYYDARVRREGFDLAWLAGIEAPPDDAREPLLVSSDWKTLGILTLVTLPAFVLFMLGGWMLFLIPFAMMQGMP